MPRQRSFGRSTINMPRSSPEIYDTKIALLNDYAENYSSMTGEQAENYIRKRAEVEQSIMQLRLKYMPAYRKVLGYSGEGEHRFRREAERHSGAKVNSSRSEATLAW